MARYAYIRVSTAAQTYDRQIHDFKKYFERMGMSWDGVQIVSEKITSHTQFTQRAIYPILKKAKEGDIIYACQLDRLGRTVSDVLNLIELADEKGVTIITINDGSSISKKTPTGRMVLTVLAAVAQMERDLRDERCQSGVDTALEELRSKGRRITKRGTVQTHWGNQKGTERTKTSCAKAREAASIARQERMIQWREQSMAVRFAMRQRAEGWGVVQITNAIGKHFDDFTTAYPDQPNPYATPTGCKPSKGHVSKWLSDANPLVA